MEYYAGVFETVYVVLHPFIKTLSTANEQFNSATCSDRAAIVQNCAAVFWADVASKAGLPSITAVDIGLRTMISGLRAEFRKEEYAGKIMALAEKEQILNPPEGRFSDLLHDKVLGAIQSLGYDWAWVGDEFGTERKLHWIEDLKETNSSATTGHCNVFTPDKALLWTTHWDSHFSFFCSSARNLRAIVEATRLEGFFCDPSTEVYWSVRP